MKIVIIGKTQVTLAFIKALLNNNNFILSGVLTDKKKGENDDYIDLAKICKSKGIKYFKTDNINSKKSFHWIKSLSPNYILCIGNSKIIRKPLLSKFQERIIGFHPTMLPNNRGKHPLIWSIILGLKNVGSTFFVMTNKIDSGKILVQKKIKILNSDNANTLYTKVIKTACSQIPKLYKSLLIKKKFFKNRKKVEGNVWRKRNFEDGIIDWRMSNYGIHNLIRALTKPYLGAKFVYKNKFYKVFNSKIHNLKSNKYQKEEHGKVLSVLKNEIIIKCGSGLISVKNIYPKLKIKRGEYL